VFLHQKISVIKKQLLKLFLANKKIFRKQPDFVCTIFKATRFNGKNLIFFFRKLKTFMPKPFPHIILGFFRRYDFFLKGVQNLKKYSKCVAAEIKKKKKKFNFQNIFHQLFLKVSRMVWSAQLLA
jgi:hypothetical protein